jgi:sulfonate transport system permease protein
MADDALWSRLLRHRATRAVLLLALWEIAGRYQWVAQGALPAPSGILARFWADKADYGPHALATFEGAAAGFVIGNLIALVAAMLFVTMPITARLFRGFNVAIFALPAIAISPVLVLTLSGMAPRIVLAAIGCYFVTMTAAVTGMSEADARAADLVRAYGGSRFALFRYVQARSGLPFILAGLKIAAPNAVLGSILAEFGGGGRFGLGVYLLGSLGRADPERLWGIGLAATLMAGAAYGVFSLIAGRVTGASRAVTMPSSPPRFTANGGERLSVRIALAVASFLMPVAIWWLALIALQVPSMIAKTPPDLIHYLFLSPMSGQALLKLGAALAQTLPMTFIGMAAGLAFAFLLALLTRLAPELARTFMPVALVTQTMPLVALTPLLVLMLGRGEAVILWITISVTFFPAFVTLAQGLLMVPRPARDLAAAYGAGPLRELRLISIPASLPYLFAAARLTAPRALLGVMIAEWLATGTGLGNLINQSRGYMDYGMIWAVAVTSTLVSALFHQAVQMVETRVLSRLGMRPS